MQCQARRQAGKQWSEGGKSGMQKEEGCKAEHSRLHRVSKQLHLYMPLVTSVCCGRFSCCIWWVKFVAAVTCGQRRTRNTQMCLYIHLDMLASYKK